MGGLKSVWRSLALAAGAGALCLSAAAGTGPLPADAKVVYGTDDRIDLYAETNGPRRSWASATCAVVNTGRLQPVDGGAAYNLGLADYRRSGLPPCADEPFGSQKTLANCSAFMVGPDLIATAGHCLDEFTMDSWRFVFGFVMEDAHSIVTQVPASQVYTPVEMVAHALNSTTREDYAVVRVDRPINVPGAAPLAIRREGVIPVDTAIGVIGHPAGLPLKLAFGPTTAVRNNSPSNYFVANLDTYGGNSGSPVFNAQSGVVEGILVRGETDYVLEATCFRSNVVADSGGRGEDVTKTTSFAQFVPLLPSGLGQLAFAASTYGCAATAQITLIDTDLLGQGTASVSVSATGGGSTTLFLPENPANSGRFTGSVNTGSLGAADGALLLGLYADANHGGPPAQVSALASIDCAPPVISGVTVGPVFPNLAILTFTTDEVARGGVAWGLSCDALTESFETDVTGTSHTVGLIDVAPSTTYYARVYATDAAGNTSVLHPDDTCLVVETPFQQDYLTRQYQNANDLQFRQLTFTPDDSPNGYSTCTGLIAALPVNPASAQILPLLDDDFAEIPLVGDATVTLYGVDYPRLFIGSNGVVTFTAGDGSYQGTLANHFSSPRVSLWSRDLNPEGTGAIRWEQLADRIVVTFLEVREWNTLNKNTMQLELFFDGVVRLSYLHMDSRNGIAGLSAGGGTPVGFTSSNFTQYPACALDPEGEGDAEGEPEGEDPPAPVEFTDATLRARVVAALALPQGPIYPADLLPLSALDAAGLGITSLAGLEHAAALATLDASDNALTDVAALAALPQLRAVNLSGNSAVIASLSPLVQNADFSQGASLDLWCALLSEAALTDAATLISQGVSVSYFYDASCGGGDGEGEGETEGDGEGTLAYSAADTNLDGRISLSELLRIIQFYNSGRFHCSPGTGDGFAPGAGAEDCAPHSTDYNPQDWRIALSELLRMIQLYNAGAYYACPDSEDGFCVAS